MDFRAARCYSGLMLHALRHFRRSYTGFILVFVLLVGVLVAPVYTASMALCAAGHAEHTVPSSKTGLNNADHADMNVPDLATDEFAPEAVSCCPNQVVPESARHASMLSCKAGIPLDMTHESRAALADPGVDLQPPRV
ncbi:hypothetical protein FP2506_00055 [Fulvimarina pelagi HTCC2506]|uniref:Uncharacterized protein n=1 Tax=Fulvimarina pelagi HTCC2506 TaxID=314231 RepID=Q0FXX4_9HYPH|nr:hypothetical protein [Fulvimarina pelagi]EAU39759.1 hypothetical protein FP2506_00055 [Fulvimarina pelagi HTCC2506]